MLKLTPLYAEATSSKASISSGQQAAAPAKVSPSSLQRSSSSASARSPYTQGALKPSPSLQRQTSRSGSQQHGCTDRTKAAAKASSISEPRLGHGGISNARAGSSSIAAGQTGGRAGPHSAGRAAKDHVAGPTTGERQVCVFYQFWLTSVDNCQVAKLHSAMGLPVLTHTIFWDETNPG